MLYILAKGGMISFLPVFYIFFFISFFLYILGSLYEIGVNSGRFEQEQAVFTFSPCIFNNRHNVRLVHSIYKMQSV
jgi:hypothetical protein